MLHFVKSYTKILFLRLNKNNFKYIILTQIYLNVAYMSLLTNHKIKSGL